MIHPVNIVAPDLHNYLQSTIPPLALSEQQALRDYTHITKSHRTDEIAAAQAIATTVVPEYAQFVKAAQAVQPRTSEVEYIHQIYVSAAQGHLAVMQRIAAHAENPSDRSWRQDTADLMSRANLNSQRYRDAVHNLAAACNMTINDAEVLGMPSAYGMAGIAGSPSNIDAALARDFESYIHTDIVQLAPYEQKARNAYAAALRQKDSAVSLRLIREQSIPAYRHLVRSAEAIHPQSPAVQGLHALFLQSARHELKVYELLGATSGTWDAARQQQITQQWKEAQDAGQKYQHSVQELARRSGGKIVSPTK